MPVSTVAALQLGSLPDGKAATLEQILGYEDEIKRSGAQLVVMPEALLAAIPKAKASAHNWATACPRGARRLPVTLPTLLMCQALKPRRWPACRRAPAPAWSWV